MEYALLLICATLLTVTSVTSSPNSGLEHAWPLSNLTLYDDVAGDSDVTHNPDKICFSFVPGPPGLGYSVFKMSEENSQYDMTLSGDSDFKDVSVSFFVYPYSEDTELSGTMFHYTYEEREIMRIRSLANTFLVSFRDEYGMSAGTMYLENFLKTKEWNHVLVTRDYKTGRIKVYLDGKEMYNEDDDFSDIISFPSGGKLRIGKSQDPDNVDAFDGDFACIQIFETLVDSDDVDSVQENCIVDDDEYKDVYYETRDGKSCLTDPPPVLPEFSAGNLVSMTTLTNELHCQAFLDEFGLDDSGQTNQKFKLLSRDKKSESTDDLIGRFNVTDRKVCSRLCMRVDNCESFLIEAAPDKADSQPCSLYKDSSISLKEDSNGAKFYAVISDKGATS